MIKPMNPEIPVYRVERMKKRKFRWVFYNENSFTNPQGIEHYGKLT